MTDKIRFCPNCGSTDTEPDTSNRAEVFFSGGNPNKWLCNKCKYTGLMPEGNPEEMEDQEIEFESEEEYRQVDTGFGIGYLKFVIYILIPLTLIYMIYLSI